jgi:hypothetical protein
LEPVDVLILDATHDSLAKTPKGGLASLDLVVSVLHVPRNHAEISIRNLIRLGLLKPGVVVAEGITYDAHPLSSYKDIELFGITELGIAFVAATRPREPRKAAEEKSAA